MQTKGRETESRELVAGRKEAIIGTYAELVSCAGSAGYTFRESCGPLAVGSPYKYTWLAVHVLIVQLS